MRVGDLIRDKVYGEEDESIGLIVAIDDLNESEPYKVLCNMGKGYYEVTSFRREYIELECEVVSAAQNKQKNEVIYNDGCNVRSVSTRLKMYSN